MYTKEIIQIKNGIIKQDFNQTVFVTFLSREKQKIGSFIREIPIFLFIWRSDGRLGFPGGKLDMKKDNPNNKDIDIEILKNTAIREIKEEIAYDIKNREHLKLSSSMLYRNNQINNFIYFVSKNEMLNIYKNFYNSIDSIYSDEIFGLNMVKFTNEYVRKEIMKQSYKATCKIEINKILEKYFTTENSSVF